MKSDAHVRQISRGTGGDQTAWRQPLSEGDVVRVGVWFIHRGCSKPHGGLGTSMSPRPLEQSLSVPRTKATDQRHYRTHIPKLTQGTKERYLAQTNRTFQPGTKTAQADTDHQ